MKKIRIGFGFLVIVSCFLLAFKTNNGLDNTDKFIVVLDAGHGGHDPGNTGNRYKEKDIALKVVLTVGAELEKDDRFKVIYTRKTDKFIELHERGSIANKAKADLFVSIHCNSHHTQASGTETFVLGLNANDENFNVAKNENSVILLEDNYEANYEGFDPNSPESIIGLTLMQEEYLDQSLTLASFVQNKFEKFLTRKSRGVKQAGFVVLHQTYMPSVLIELGFLTNNKEGKYLNSGKGQREMSKSIKAAIMDYKESLDKAYKVSEIKTKVDPVIEDTTTSDSETLDSIIFKVQISASSNDLQLQPSNFNGLDQLSKRQTGKLFKYYFGNTTDYKKIKVLKDIAIEKGFDSSFVVAFRNNQIIPLSEVLKVSIPSN